MNRFAGSRRGASAIEFAVALPLLLVLTVGVTEFGRMTYQANALEKSLRAGALFAARSEFPIDGATETTIGNLVRTGNVDGTGEPLVPGWADGSATLAITTRTVDIQGDADASNDVPVIRLVASVPFEPLMPGLMETFGFSNLRISAAHEQTYIGI